MTRTTRTGRTLRRVLAAGVVATAAAASQALPASAQTTPTPVPIDDVCAAVPERDAFSDVAESDARAAAIRCLAHAHVTTGVASDRYAPSRSVTRQQMASFIARTIDAAVLLDAGDRLTPLPDEASNRFSDVSLASPHWENINRLAEVDVAAGGAGGRPATRFAPDLRVTRSQMASFIVRGIEHLTGTTLSSSEDHFTDDDTSTHEESIDVLADLGIVQGYGDRRYGPDRSVNRATMASYLTRTLAHLESEALIEPLPAIPAPAAPVVVASADGVTVHDADLTTRTVVSERFSPSAYAIGSDIVAFQQDGQVHVWKAGEVEVIPVPEAMSATLLDARMVDGVPTALVAERRARPVGPPDGSNELLLIDLDDHSRTTIEHQVGAEAWEAGFSHGRILPDGDVVVISYLETRSTLARWSTGSDDPAWSTELGAELRADLAVFAGTIRVVGVSSADDGGQELTVRAYDPTTGTAGDPRSVVLADVSGVLDSVVACAEQVSTTGLLCTRRDATPVAVDLDSGWFAELPVGAAESVTVQRPA